MKETVVRSNDLNPWRTHCDAFPGCDEGRASELSRRATFVVLFTRDGRPGMWLGLVAAAWAVVAATTLGLPG